MQIERIFHLNNSIWAQQIENSCKLQIKPPQLGIGLTVCLQIAKINPKRDVILRSNQTVCTYGDFWLIHKEPNEELLLLLLLLFGYPSQTKLTVTTHRSAANNNNNNNSKHSLLFA